MKDCCQQSYDAMFDPGKAQKQLARYLKKGVKRSSRLMIKALTDLPLHGSMLDIGGGIGALSFELLKKGMKQSTHVDISQAYVRSVQAEAARRGWSEQLRSLQGDFLRVYPQLEMADLVLLDKVICCYENYPALIQHSTAKSRRWYVCTIPRDKWWVKTIHILERWGQQLSRDPFRSFIHPVSQIESLIQKAGFQKINQQIDREWMTLVYERSGEGKVKSPNK